MVYETSYDSGRKPFTPDLARGSWSSPNDFVWLCVALAFKMDFFGITWYYIGHTGVYIIFPYLFWLMIYGVPLLIVHMFLGQFSGTGFISSLRLAPFFKGIGFISLFLNISVLFYYSVFVTVPLIYFFNSFRPTIPWSCEEGEKWNTTIACPPLAELDVNETSSNETLFEVYHIPSVLYFNNMFENTDFYNHAETSYEFSWPLFGCNMVGWAAIAIIFYKFSQTGKFGQIMRYLVWTVLGILVLCVFRFSFLPGAEKVLTKFFTLSPNDMFFSFPVSFVAIVSSFGGGWGIIVSLASHNNFKSNIVTYSWTIALGQLLVNILLGLCTQIVEEHYTFVLDTRETAFTNPIEAHWALFLSAGTAIANLHWGNLWCLLYYGMLATSAIIIMCIQIQTISVSFFDEFDSWRAYKMEMTMGLIGIAALASTYFCSNHGVLHFFALSLDSLFTSSAIMLLIILIALWIYGRERFQRDIEFMLSVRFATWKVYSLRFIAPFGLIFCLFAGFILAYLEHGLGTAVIIGAAILFVLIPWLFIPIYGVLGMLYTSGSFWARFKRCCRPTDWYPVDQEHRQRYEEAMGNMDITHQLNEVRDDAL